MSKILVLVSPQYGPPFADEMERLAAQGLQPRSWISELPVEFHVLDRRFLEDGELPASVPVTPPWRRRVYRRLPVSVAQGVEAYLIRRRYDVVFAWGAEPAALIFCALQVLRRRRTPFVGLLNWISPPKKARLLRLVRPAITTLVLPSSVQARFAVQQLGLRSQDVVSIPWCVDTDFWQPVTEQAGDVVCAVGREMRDYATLIRALEGTGIPCHIAAPWVEGKMDRWKSDIGTTQLPEGVTVGPMNPVELRALYGRSRFVVVPLLPSDTDNGTTVILEAMSMGRAVLCSETEGQQDVLVEGDQGRLVPPGDVDALREALVEMWADVEGCDRMGKQGRNDVEARHTVGAFADAMADVLARATGHR